GRCQGVADRKSTMPVLGNVLLETTDTGLRLAATDLVLAVSGVVTAEVKKKGSVALGAKDLFDRVRMMPEGEIILEVTEGATTVIRAQGSARRYTIHGVPGTEFPALPSATTGSWLELDVSVVARLVAGTYFSISTDETRLHLSSALFEYEDNRVRMVTTDGHRLSKMEIRAPSVKGKGTMLIPLKGIHELRRLCDEALSDQQGDETPQLRVAPSGNNVYFEVAGFRFSVKLVDATFPPYQQVIPAQSEKAIRAPRGALSDALKAVSLAASDRTGGVKLTLSKSSLRVESESPEAGEGFDEIAIDYDGADITIGLNAKYFLDVMNAISDDEVILGISGELDPAVIRPAGDAIDREYLAVVMPMRI
ncbi:MAG TPA: DNA polymerase III subunit beta, partial [Polyangiaceae bacterium]|nr:DNA polymerase III subunit beta [Polyangiaceae bacterium]